MAAFTYAQIYDSVSSSASVQNRVTVALVRAAEDIYSEASPPANHDRRAALATRVLNGPQNFAQLFALVCGVDATIQAAGVNPTDAQILSAIKAGWDAVAGA